MIHNKIMINLLDKQTFAQIQKYIEVKTFPKGGYLFRQDEVCKRIYWIKKGICRKYYLHDGKEITTEILFENNFVSSAKSFVLQKPSNEFARAITEVETWSLTKSNFALLKEQHPEIQSLDLKFVELYVIWLEERLFQFHTQDATTRYSNLLRDHPHYIQQIPLNYIASFLGISLETLSRIRAKVAKNIT